MKKTENKTAEATLLKNREGSIYKVQYGKN